MSTTTVRLSDELKTRIDRLAAAEGKSSHAFMVEALAQATDRRERQLAFDAEVQQRWDEMQRSGEFASLADLRRYAMARARGEVTSRPVGKPAAARRRAAR